MQRRTFLGLMSAVGCTTALLAGCGSEEASETATSGAAATSGTAAHEPITMLSAFMGTNKFVDLVHEKYPEINLEIIPYSGANMTGYVSDELKTGNLPDIYVTTIYAPGQEDLSDRLIDVSGYDFTNNFAEARLRDVSDNGSIYLLPAFFSCLGITYNKTLFDKHGWAVPATFGELEELASKAEEAGCTLAVDQLKLPGYGFQYFCNIMDAGFLNTLDGRKWQNDFLSGGATFKGSSEMMSAISALDKWRDVGMLCGDSSMSAGEAKKQMAQGNTLFMLGASNSFTKDQTTDEFGLMPYLSEDGTQNALILNVSRYFGLSKRLEDEGNEQKLQDAVHVMEVMSSIEGMSALTTGLEDSTLLPFRDYTISPTSYYKQIEDDLNAGMTAPFIYAGWDNVIVPVGEVMLSYIAGTATTDDVAEAFDASQPLLKDDSAVTVTRAVETLDTDACARLVGIAFGKASGADLSLISTNKWYAIDGGFDSLNKSGVSGSIFPMNVKGQEIVAILPTGWSGDIETVTLGGKRIKELVETGYDRNGQVYPYVLVAPEGFAIDDDAAYTVAICGASDEVAEEGNLTDTGIVGLDAATEYLSQFETLSASDLVWD